MIELLTHNPKWIELFKKESEFLKTLFPTGEFYHIGSTTISTIKAKPIVDILGAVDDINLAEKIANYEAFREYGIEGRRFFIKKNGDKKIVHLHIYQKGNCQIDKHLKFVNLLKNSSDLAKEYEKLKLDLAAKFDNTNDYAEAKGEFIEGLLKVGIF